jgi:anti-sigma factor ChrR (cupin superfamily)
MTTDTARIIRTEDRPWLPFPGVEGEVKILSVDEERNVVVFMMRLPPGGDFGTHRHLCQAIAYTTAGEWFYEEGAVPVGAVAVEPVGSTHAPRSDHGGEGLVILVGDGPDLIEFVDEEGNAVGQFGIDFFKMLHGLTPEEAARLGEAPTTA